MAKSTGPVVPCPATTQDVLTDVLREGARKMLLLALEAEVEEYTGRHAVERDENGHRLVVRNGYMPERNLVTPMGMMTVEQPRVEDRRVGPGGERMRFTSRILPPYLRKTKQIDELLPWLYLKGISTNDFSEALAALLGPDAAGLSATTVARLKALWVQEHQEWSRRSLRGKRYVYLWVDGVYFNVRLEGERQCILIVMGATAEGRKELVAVYDGVRESEQSWRELLLDLKARGLKNGPELAIGDGALGFWKALPQVYGKCRMQRCWVHKTANVLNYLPKSAQASAKAQLHEIWMAETKAKAEKAFDTFVETYGAKYPKAVECLKKDREALLTFYDFPGDHWIHIRTTNPIESTFATVRLRTDKTKGCGTRLACLAMVFKLAQSAEKRWRRLNGHKLFEDVMKGVKFVDGRKQEAA
jgi:putative transposase